MYKSEKTREREREVIFLFLFFNSNMAVGSNSVTAVGGPGGSSGSGVHGPSSGNGSGVSSGSGSSGGSSEPALHLLGFTLPIKYISLLILVLQNSALFLMLRASRTTVCLQLFSLGMRGPFRLAQFL